MASCPGIQDCIDPSTLAELIKLVPSLVDLANSTLHRIKGQKYKNRRHKAEIIFRAMGIHGLNEQDLVGGLGCLIPNDYLSDELLQGNMNQHWDAITNPNAPAPYRNLSPEKNRGCAALAMAVFAAKHS